MLSLDACSAFLPHALLSSFSGLNIPHKPMGDSVAAFQGYDTCSVVTTCGVRVCTVGHMCTLKMIPKTTGGLQIFCLNYL